MAYRVNYNKLTRKKKKYNNTSTTYTSSIHGTKTFHSKKEAQYCEELDWLLKAGEIKSYELQKKIEIWVNGERICNYYIDFVAIDKHNQVRYIEVKGFETDVWRFKWRLCMALKDNSEEENESYLVGVEPHAEWEVVK